LLDDREAFYGGAAGPGKSDGLLMAALQYVDVPGYDALLLRENYGQLAMPGALMERANEWLGRSDARWRQGTKTWTFPSSATLTFGHLSNPQAVRRYESAQFNFVGVDEVTQFSEETYLYMFSRLRRLRGFPVPSRMRSAGMPQGRGRAWVKRRFVDEATREPTARFVRARLSDNPFLDQEDYETSLRLTHPVTWRRLLLGDWEVTEGGTIFRPREWVREWRQRPPQERGLVRVRYWDLAYADEQPGTDPDWTVGALWSLNPRDGTFCVEHVERFRATSGTCEERVAAQAGRDGTGVRVWIEQAPGAGAGILDRYKRHVLRGYHVRGDPPKGSKEERAVPVAGAMENGLVSGVAGRWNDEWLDEHEAFPDDAHDDQVDTSSGAHKALSRIGRRSSSSSAAGAEIAR